jgi:DNA-binding NarL/FixJ family response regulator
MIGEQTRAPEPLVGRAAELEQLDQALLELDDGRPAAVEILGEPGIGKSRLLGELARRAEQRGHVALAGRASELEQDLPFWVFVDALDEYLQALEPGRLELLDDDVRAELALLFPSVPTPRTERGVALRDERYRAHRAVRELLEVLAAKKPVVLMLDDLHWADSGSIELIGALLHRPPSAPVLLAVALRPRQVPERLSAALERAYRTGALTRAELVPLTRDEAATLLGGQVAEAVASDLYTESGGNPFYLEELARAVRRGAEAPSGVVAALTEEFALLSPLGRTVLQGAAVAGDPFEPELAAAAAAISEAQALEGLDELLLLDLIRATDVPRRFRFRHPLVRRAVYEAAPGGWRLAAHERTAAALAALGAPASARAHHVEQSSRVGDEGAIALLREAGESVARRTPAGAARWFAAALRLLPAEAPAEERVSLLTAFAGARAATGRFADAHAALVECIELVGAEGGELFVKLTAACAGIEQLLGQHEASHARLESALVKTTDSDSPLAVTLQISLALESFYRQRYGDAMHWSERALSSATAGGEDALIAAASAASALAAACAGHVDRAEQLAGDASARVDAMTDAELAAHLEAVANLAGAETYLDRYAAAIAHAERGLALARSTGQGELLPILIPVLVTALGMTGRLRDAAELSEGAIEGARLVGNHQTLAWQLLNRAFVAVQSGEVELALETGRESWELASTFEDNVVSTYAGVVLATVYLEAGDPGRAVELFVASAGGEALPLYPGGDRALFLGHLTRSLLAVGRTEDAARAAAAAQAVAATTPRRLVTAWADRASAAVALASGDHDFAAEKSLASAAGADEVGAPLEAALSRSLAGRALAQAGDRARALEELERAASAFDAYGAQRYRDEAERDLRKLGRRIQRTPRGRADGVGLDSLTERELQVARLVVERKTNPEIAAELFLSLKTVETHLRHIFGKLGVSSRVEVARTIEGAASRDTAGPSPV